MLIADGGAEKQSQVMAAQLRQLRITHRRGFNAVYAQAACGRLV